MANWFTEQPPPRWLIILGGWLGLNKRLTDLERRVAELERKLRG